MGYARILLLVGIFGALGAVSRFLLTELVYRGLGRGFPLGTLLVNVLGCFLLGALAQITSSSDAISGPWRAGLSAGFLGGLTTFSTFSLETYGHFEQGRLAVAGGNVILSLGLGLAGVWAGAAFVKAMA